MEKSLTVTGKPFYYNGDLSSGLTVNTCDRKGKINDSGFLISSEIINIIRKTIISPSEILMEACRDNPARDSIGYVLYHEHKSPQSLSYVIPQLAQEKFCTYFKKGNAYYIRCLAEK